MYLYICLGHLFSFPGLVWSVLVLRGRVYGPGLVWILLQFRLRDIRAGFCGGSALGHGGTFGYKERTPGNSGAVEGSSLFGGMRGEPLQGVYFSWLPVTNTICLVGSLLGHTTIPYLRESSFISLSWKKIWTYGISVHFPCLLQNKSSCRMVL